MSELKAELKAEQSNKHSRYFMAKQTLGTTLKVKRAYEKLSTNKTRVHARSRNENLKKLAQI